MPRLETVGYKQNGIIGYTNTIQSNEFTQNERVPQGACLTFCTGRFAMLQHKTIVFYEPTCNQAAYDQAADVFRAPTIPRIMQYDAGVQNNFYITADDYNNRVRFLYLDYKEIAGGDDHRGCIVGYYADADYGMNVNNKGAYYSGVRFVSDFKYNNVCLIPRIYRVAINKIADANYNIPFYYESLTLKQFYIDNATWSQLPDWLTDFGYALGFELVPGLSMFAGSEFRVNDTLHVNPNEGIFSNLNMQDNYAIIDTPCGPDNYTNSRHILLGYAGFGGFQRNYANAPTATYIGPHSIEGIQLIEWRDVDILINEYYPVLHQGGYWVNERAIIKGTLPTLKREPFDSRLITLNDCIRMCCSVGLPIDIEGNVANYVSGGRTIQDAAALVGTDEYIYYPIIGDNGQIDTEQFAHGLSEIEKTNIYKKTEDGTNPFEAIDEYNYNDIDTNDYVDEIQLNKPPITTVGVFNRMYALSREDIDDFANFIYTSNESQIQNMLEGLKLNGEHPMDFIIGLKQFPFNIRTYATVEEDTEITFGNGVHTNVMADLIKDTDIVIDMGSCTFRKYYNNFLDYEPYTTAKLYIPYCGELPISTAEFVGHEVRVKLIVDVYTGTCCAVVYRDKIPYAYVNGDIGADIMITGTDSWAYVENYKSMVLGSTQSLLGAGNQATQTRNTSGSAMSGNTVTGQTNASANMSTSVSKVTSVAPTQVLGAGLSIADNIFEWQNQGTPIYTSGGTSPLIAFYKPQNCYLIIEQNLPMSISDYGNSYGYACMRRGKLSDYDIGTLVVAANYKGQPPNATLPETLEIKQLLESGVWR